MFPVFILRHTELHFANLLLFPVSIFTSIKTKIWGKSRPSFEETHPHLRKFNKFLPELNKESDRGMVLIAASYLDELMLEILKSYFITGKVSSALVEGFNAPLGTLSTRCSAAYSLGLISKTEFGEADLIRKIRNNFAHNIHTSFEDMKVVELCNKLEYAAKDYDNVVVSSRGKFSTSAVCLILNLTNRPHYVSQKKCKSGEWSI